MPAKNVRSEEKSPREPLAQKVKVQTAEGWQRMKKKESSKSGGKGRARKAN